MKNNTIEKEEILEYYNAGQEKERLFQGIGQIEFERTKEIISRYLLNDRQVIYDIGGGTGIYSRWLAEKGHEVHMFELSLKAVEYAKNINEKSNLPIHSIEVSDAREINREDESADIVLVMGPLYHIVEREERLKALKEAKRILKNDGIMICATISRFGSTLYGLSVYGRDNNLIDEDEFMGMIGREMTDGHHIRPEKYPKFIPRAFFHLPGEIESEIKDVGLKYEKIYSVEGPIWIVPSFEEKWKNTESKERLLNISRKVEEEESLMGMSPHLLLIAKK